MRGQRCREYAMTVIGMVGRCAVQGDAIREERAVYKFHCNFPKLPQPRIGHNPSTNRSFN